MKVDRKELYEALTLLAKVADKKSSIPILAYVHLEMGKKFLRLRTTDLNRTLVASLHATGKLDTCCVNVEKLMKTVRPDTGVKGGNVEITTTENRIVVVVDGLNVKLPTVPAADFPTAPMQDHWNVVASWDSAELAAALAYVVPAASVDVTRPYICAVAFATDGRCIATDGHRLHLVPLSEGPKGADIIILREAAVTLATIAKDDATVQLCVRPKGEEKTGEKKSVVQFTVGNYELTVRQAEDDFPPWDQVIPRLSGPATLVMDVAQLSKAVKKLNAIVDDSICGIKLTTVPSAGVTLTASTYDSDEIECSVDVVRSYDESSKVIKLNGRLILDALVGCKGTVELSIEGQLDPLVVYGTGGRLAVVMPMRI